jgi:hypothetical protein
MPKLILAIAAAVLTYCSVAMAAPRTVDPSVLDHLMSGYHVEYRVIGQLMLPGEDFAVRYGGYPTGNYHLGTSIEWTPDGGQHEYLTTVFDLGDEGGLDGLVWLTDKPTFVMSPEGYRAFEMFPVTETNLQEASDLVLGQLDNIASSDPNGPPSTFLITASGGAFTGPLSETWPSLVPGVQPASVPEPTTLALSTIGAVALFAINRRRRK